MKILGLVLSSLFLLAMPTLAADYQGRSIDGRKLTAKVYSYKTGGLYDAQVEFKRDLATIYFANGGQLSIRLNQRTINDPDNILGYGRLGQIPVTRWLGLGVSSEDGIAGSATIGGGKLEDLWRISLKPFSDQ